MNSLPMIFRFCCGSVTPFSAVRNCSVASAVTQIDLEMIAESGFDQLPLVFPQQAVVDEDADQLFADGFVQQGGDDGAIHPAGKAADHRAVADLLANLSRWPAR